MAASTPRALRLGAACCLAAAALAACGDDDAAKPGPVAAPDAGSPWLKIGRGETAFAPLTEDEALPYVRGSQGGFHVWVSFRMQGLDPQRVLIAVTTEVEGHPELQLERRGRQNFAAAGGAGAPDGGVKPGAVYEYAGWPAQILDAPLHVGARVHIHASLEDLQARLVRADTMVIIAAPDTVHDGDDGGT
jgi:hypothetical protein